MLTLTIMAAVVVFILTCIELDRLDRQGKLVNAPTQRVPRVPQWKSWR